MSSMNGETATPAGVRIAPAGGKGFGVFATHTFDPGEVVIAARKVRELPRRTSHSLQIGWDRHIEVDLPARLVNHSCDPNVGIRDNDCDAYDFVALTDIAADEEITWDYAASEWVSIAVPTCRCGSASFRGASLGYQYLSPRQTAGLHGYTARYLTTPRQADDNRE